MYNKIIQIPTFKELTENDILENLIKGCYPLAPVVTYALHKLSEKIAQSNRTLFTFLISDDENSLGDFINSQRNSFKLQEILYMIILKRKCGERIREVVFTKHGRK